MRLTADPFALEVFRLLDIAARDERLGHECFSTPPMNATSVEPRT